MFTGLLVVLLVFLVVMFLLAWMWGDD